MTEAIIVQPNALYDDGQLCLLLNVTSATTCRARREGQLRFTRKGKRVFYLGQWVLDWMSHPGLTRGRELSHA